jgi:cytochrome c oxidase cbb3-type subunit 3
MASLRNRVRWLFLLLALMPLLIGHAQSDDSAKTKSVQRGQAQFASSCAMCHGAAATGGAGPNLIQSSLVRHDQGGDLIGPVVLQGRADRGMPAFPTMTSGDVSDLAAFLSSLVAAASVTSSSGQAKDKSLEQLLTGNAERGKRYFNGAGGCSACHSPTGDLAAISGKYSPTELQDRFLSPPAEKVTVTVSLQSGQKVQGKLLHLDPFYVAIEDEEGWYRSWPLAQVKVEVKHSLDAHTQLLGKYTDKDIHDLFAYLETIK